MFLKPNETRDLCPFLTGFFVFNCYMSSLHILDISLSLEVLFANIFFHSGSCLFYFIDRLLKHFFQEDTERPTIYENILNSISYKGNANKSHSEILLQTC